MTMNVLVLTEGALVPATRFRVLPYLRHLEADGIRCAVDPADPPKYAWSHEHPWNRPGVWRIAYGLLRWRSLRDRRRAVSRAAGFDAVLLQRDLSLFDATGDLEEALARINPRIVLDFDDAIWLAGDGSPCPAREAKIRRIVGLARVVTAGNETLRAWAGGGDRVVLLPTPIDTDHYTPAPGPRPAGGPFVIGWIGLRSNLPYLMTIAGPLAKATRARDAIVRIVCDRPPDPATLPFRAETVAWSAERELEMLRSFDAGLMPLPDNAWTRGKCGLKLLQYLAMGIPAAASPVGVNTEILSGGEAGLLPNGEAAWEEALERLILDAPYRAAAGRAGRARAEAEYSVARWAPVLARTLRKASGS
jgi:glycosyltransferase involved in cell wall biosynthesis